MIDYQQYPPCPALAPYVVCLWTCHVHAGAAAIAHRVLPDNCIDILWQDSDPEGGVAGMMSKAIVVPFDRPVHTVAVRFKPGAAAHFFDLPLDALTDLHPCLRDLWGADLAGRCADALWRRPLSDRAALGVIERLLLVRLRASTPRPGLVEHAVAALQASHGNVQIAALAATLGVSRQHLASQFRSRVGLGAKQFSRICRFQHASARLQALGPGQADMAALALDLGYYDQPHMIHEFRALADSTPHAFATN
jgi:AraC-like DNA-binding protein